MYSILYNSQKTTHRSGKRMKLYTVKCRITQQLDQCGHVNHHTVDLVAAVCTHVITLRICYMADDMNNTYLARYKQVRRFK